MILHKLKHYTAWATSTVRKNRLLHYWQRFRGRRRRLRGLTWRILAVNMTAPLVLVIGVLYMGQYRESLINAELETLKVQSQLFAGAVAEGAVRPVDKGRPFLFARPEEIEILVPELSRRIIRRLGSTTENRTRLFDNRGVWIGDSHQSNGRPATAQEPDPLETAHPPSVPGAVARSLMRAMEMVPNKSTLPEYPFTGAGKIEYYPDAELALQGRVAATAWRNKNGKVIMTAAAPVQKSKQLLGVVMLTRDGKAIEQAMMGVRFDVLTAFAIALGLTVLLSLYLAGIIARPMKKLARAAEAIRQGHNRQSDIPDLSYRQDEIGELSQALRDMTQALWDRMDMIESFAADVAHEIKNPLTSLRSAVETAARITNEDDRSRLMEIILHDVQRLDRLITDISRASRLDAELSRDARGVVDLRALLTQLADMHRAPLDRGADGDATQSSIVVVIPEGRTVTVSGNETRLAQVFENLISNALSFSPPGKPIIVSAYSDRLYVTVYVEDSGPGIPENNLETIFERFYTERRHESYGRHSGLGLSIARQIIDAHDGRIFAENLKDENGQVMGARFTVMLKAV